MSTGNQNPRTSGRGAVKLLACVLAFVLLSACTGPTDAEALRDAALDLQDAQQQARAERRGEIHQAQALAMLAASGRK